MQSRIPAIEKYVCVCYNEFIKKRGDMNMKTFFRILLSILVILSFVFSAFSESIMPDKTYEDGKTYSLMEEKIDLSGLDVYAPAHALESLGFPKSDQEGLVCIGTYDEIFKSHPLTLKYASDDLSTVMFDGMVCLRNGKLIITYPSYTRGAEDTYGVFDRVMNSAVFARAATRSGMIFSDDGRYALYIDGYSALAMARFDYQLFILDVEAGEWYLGYTWPTKISEGAQCVVSACFDETNEYIYIKSFGNAYKNKQSLLRYHIGTGKMELMSNNDLWSAYANISRTPDGTYVYELNPMRTNQPGGIVEYREIEGKWYAIPHHFHTSFLYQRATSLEVNSKTGQGLMQLAVSFQKRPIDSNDSAPGWNSFPAFSLPVFKDGIHFFRDLVLFDDAYAHARRVSIHEYTDYARQTIDSGNSFPMIANAVLSPDGKYAFIVILNNGIASARILNTETMDVSMVSFEEGDVSVKAAFANASNIDYPIGVQWIRNDLILINTESGVRLFRIM